jgi:two-component system CheB/CheR fusion protein
MSQNAHPLRILLVEDHDDTAEVTAKLLRKCGHIVLVGKTCAAGLDAAKTGFDVLLADIRLPDGSGVQLLHDLRGRGPVKAIATTAEVMPEDIKRYISAGFDAVMFKPYDFRKLEEKISELTMRISGDTERNTFASQSA